MDGQEPAIHSDKIFVMKALSARRWRSLGHDDVAAGVSIQQLFEMLPLPQVLVLIHLLANVG